MFNELLELGGRLARQGKLPPPGFYYYKEPIKWVVHFDPDKPENSAIRRAAITNLPRPYSGRASGTDPYPAADEAAYVLGIDQGKGKGKDTATKHSKFLNLLDKIATSCASDDQKTSRIVMGIKGLLTSELLQSSPLWGEIESKDWVSIQIEEPEGDGKQLIEHPMISEFWVKELAERCLPGNKERKGVVRLAGECGISGNKESSLVGRIPLAVTLYKPAPLHSLNADAFVSGIEGTGVFKRCHVGQGIEAGDLITRTLNYLRSRALHHKVLAKAIEAGKLNTDSPQNLFAFYWIEQPEQAKAAVSINPAEILSKTSLLFGEDVNEDDNATVAKKVKFKTKLPVELSQLEALLNTPWTAQQQALRLDENAFCLLTLSPNKGRISVREWFKVGLGRLKGNLKEFLDAQRIESPDGGAERSFAIQDMLRVLEESNISQPEYKAKEFASPNIARALLRCAYLGEAPPSGLIEPAVICFRHPKVLRRYEQKSDRERFALLQHQLAAIMKLILTHIKSEVRMNDDDHISLASRSPAFLSGFLLAVLEEAQLASMNWKINTTLIDQFYSTAATTPGSVLGMLISRVTAQHMPKLRKNMHGKYEKIEILMESIQSTVDELGGFPRTLTLKQQAEFSLGFYTQRAAFRRERPTKTTSQPAGQAVPEQGVLS